jgi:hypothetical protein
MRAGIEIVRSKRRTIAVEVKRDLRVIVRVPIRMKEKDAERFIDENSAWIEARLEIVKAQQACMGPGFTDAELDELYKAEGQWLPDHWENEINGDGRVYGNTRRANAVAISCAALVAQGMYYYYVYGEHDANHYRSFDMVNLCGWDAVNGVMVDRHRMRRPVASIMQFKNDNK